MIYTHIKHIKPYLWRGGKAFPKNDRELRQLVNDGEIDIGFSFAIGFAASQILNGDLPETVRTFVLKKGTISNTHFVAIPYNSSSKEASQVVANFLISTEAQARKLDPNHIGDYTDLQPHQNRLRWRLCFCSPLWRNWVRILKKDHATSRFSS